MKALLASGTQSYRGFFLWIVAVLLAAGLIEGIGYGAEIVFVAMTLMLLSATRLAHAAEGRSTFLICAFATMMASAAAYLTSSMIIDVGAMALVLGVFCYVTWLIFLSVFSGTEVNTDTIFGAVCVYILIGIVCAVAYQLIELVDSSAFTLTVSDGYQPVLNPAEAFFRTFIYFSFSTLTTVGFGDIVPVSSPARYVAILEAICGQIYLSVLVARLVGLHLTTAKGPR